MRRFKRLYCFVRGVQGDIGRLLGAAGKANRGPSVVDLSVINKRYAELLLFVYLEYFQTPLFIQGGKGGLVGDVAVNVNLRFERSVPSAPFAPYPGLHVDAARVFGCRSRW